MRLPYTLYFINTMLDHYEDRLEEAKTDEEKSFLRTYGVRMYRRLQKQSITPLNTSRSHHMKTIDS